MESLLNISGSITAIYFGTLIGFLILALLFKDIFILIMSNIVLSIIASIGFTTITAKINCIFPSQIEINKIKYEKIKNFPITTGYKMINSNDTVYFDDKTIKELNK